MDKTKIEWTDATWNPIRGCSMAKGSELGGCLNCYAAAVAARFSGEGMPYAGLARVTENGPRWTGKIRVLSDEDAGDVLTKPLRWKRPRRIFVNSMSDLFHEQLPFSDVNRIVAVMALARQHTFQVLTKRPERMALYLNDPDRREQIAAATMAVSGGQVYVNGDWPLSNVWWGVSAENQQTLDARMPHVIRALPNMKLAWLSAEPLLGPLPNLWKWLPHTREVQTAVWHQYPGLGWVVAGGESGPNARPMHPAWPTDIRNQCRKAGVPFLFKQWGNWRPAHQGDHSYDTSKGRAGSPPAFLVSTDGTVHCHRETAGEDPAVMIHAGKKAAGRLLDGRPWDEYPDGAERTE